jgi:hypothetical protein
LVAQVTQDQKSLDSPVEMEAKLSDVCLNISPTTVHIFLDIMEIINEDGRRVWTF